MLPLIYALPTMYFYFPTKYNVISYLHVFGICKFLHDLFSNKLQTKVVLPETLNSASFAHKMAICQLFRRYYIFKASINSTKTSNLMYIK